MGIKKLSEETIVNALAEDAHVVISQTVEVDGVETHAVRRVPFEVFAAELPTSLANIATVESTTTASRAHAVGDLLVYDNVLYKVTTAIASGGTIAVGANVTATTVEAELEGINSSVTTAQGDIDALETDVSAMNTATASDEGKALKAKTVTNGKVTEWEFGEAGGDTSALETLVNSMNNFGSTTVETEMSGNYETGYYSTDGDVGTTASTTLNSNSNYKGMYFAVSAGDQVTLSADNGRNHNVWALTDIDFTILEKSGVDAVTDATVTATVDGYFFVCTGHPYVYSVVLKTSDPITLHEKMDSVDDDIDAVEASASANATAITKKIPYPVSNGNVVLPTSKKGVVINTDGTAEYADMGISQDEVDRNAVKIPNIVVDPMFTDLTDTDAITFTNETGTSDGDGVLTITVSRKVPNVNIKIADTESTDLLFYSINLVNGANWKINVRAVHDSGGVEIASGATQTIDGVTTGGTDKVFRIYYGSAVTGTITVTMPIVVNLTAVFGAGHEPTYTQFKTMLENWTRDDFHTWISRQKYDYILGSPKLYATNYLVKTATDTSSWNDVEKTATGDGSASSISSSREAVSTNDYAYTDILYIAVMAKASGEPTKLSLTKANASTDAHEIATQDSPTADTWYHLSAIATNRYTSAPDFQYIYAHAYYADATAQSGQTLTYKCAMALNLTEIFGAGNEPMDVTAIDAMLSRYTDYWFAGSQDIWNPSIIPWLMFKYREFSDGTYLGSDDACIKIGSAVDTSWNGWSYGQRSYGMTPKYSPVYNQVHGVLESDGMVSVIPLYGRWGYDARGGDATAGTNSGGDEKGGHVFEGWNRHGTYRLTLMMAHGYGDIREDEACIITYCPGVFNSPMIPFTEDELENRMTRETEDYYGETATYMLGRIRIGSDKYGEGTEFRRMRTTFRGNVFFDGSYGTVASSSASGEKGCMKYDEDYLYICVADNTWRRVALSTF